MEYTGERKGRDDNLYKVCCIDKAGSQKQLQGSKTRQGLAGPTLFAR